MVNIYNREMLQEALEGINYEGEIIEVVPFGSGHINDTYLVRSLLDGKEVKYALQRINHNIFKDPVAVMENVVAVTDFLKKKIMDNGGDVKREVINLISNKNNTVVYKDSNGNYWRGYHFIDGATSYDLVEREEDFYQSALGFGNFQNLLSDYPAETLNETIKDFHNTPVRFENFKKAVEEDVCGRASSVKNEINFVLSHKDFVGILMDLLNNNQIPTRVTHNDTKLNNVLIDNATGKALCIMDLDTVMPGLSVNDFGDSIRFGASTASEDEKDLSKVNFDLNLFEIYTKGFLEGCKGSLTDVELDMLPVGAKMMTLECGMRFLTDYLQGDTYFKTSYDTHNLDRARTQFKLVSEMDKNWDKMKEIVDKYR